MNQSINYQNFHLIAGGLFLLLILVLLSSQTLVDADLGWHLKTGEFILKNISIPRFDPFSYTAFNKPWINHEWLSQAVLYAIYFLSGETGLVISGIFILFLSYFFISLSALTRNNILSVFILILLSFFLSYPRFLVRPDIFNLFFFSLYLYILEKKKYIHIIVIIQLIWINMHGAFLFGYVLTGAYAIECVIHTLKRHEPWKNIFNQRIVLVFLFSLLLLPLNPYGLKGVVHPFEQVGSSAFINSIQEWISPFSLTEFEKITAISLYYYYLFFLFFVLILSFKKIHYSHYIILAVHTFFSISSQRYIVFLSLASVTIFSAPLALILNKIITYFQNMRMRWIKSSFILVFYLVCLGILFFVGSGRLFYSDRSISRFGLTFSELAFPQNGVKFVKESGLPMPIFNNYDAGGYLIFKDLKVFIDGRNLVYGEKFFLQYLRIMSEPDILDTFFDIYGIKTVILRHSSQECRIMIQTLANNPLWKLIFLDPVSAVYVKKEYSTPFNEIDINNPQVDILLNALKDFRTKIKYFPNPEINLGNFFLNAGNYKTGAIFFMKAVEKAPETDFLHFNLGAIYLRENKYDNALSEFLAVLKLNKNFKNLYRSIAQTYANLARWDDAIVYYNKAIEKEPDAPALKIDAGRILCKNQKISEGIKYFKSAITLTPHSEDAYFYLGSAYLEALDYQNALYSFDCALKINQKSEKLLLAKGDVLARLGRFDEAGETFKSVLEYYPSSIQGLKGLAQLNIIQKKFDYALPYLNKILEIAPDSDYANYQIGIIKFEYFNSPLEAKPYLENALKLLPQGDKHREKVEELLKKLINQVFKNCK